MVEPARRLSEPPTLPAPPSVPEPAAERRGAARTPVRFDIGLEGLPWPVHDARALNVSASGLLIRTAIEPPLWSRLTAVLPAIGPREVRIVRRDGYRYGCLFGRPLDGEELDALLTCPEAEAGFAALRAEANAPQPPVRGGVFRRWRGRTLANFDFRFRPPPWA